MNIVNAGSRYQVYGEDVKTYKELPIATYSVGFNPMMSVTFLLRKMESVIGLLSLPLMPRLLMAL